MWSIYSFTFLTVRIWKDCYFSLLGFDSTLSHSSDSAAPAGFTLWLSSSVSWGFLQYYITQIHRVEMIFIGYVSLHCIGESHGTRPNRTCVLILSYYYYVWLGRGFSLHSITILKIYSQMPSQTTAATTPPPPPHSPRKTSKKTILRVILSMERMLLTREYGLNLKRCLRH